MSPPRRNVWGALGQHAAVWLLGLCFRRHQAGECLWRGVLGHKGAGGSGCCLRLVKNWCLPRVGSCGGAARPGCQGRGPFQVRGRPAQPPRHLGVSYYWLFGGRVVAVLGPVSSEGCDVAAGGLGYWRRLCVGCFPRVGLGLPWCVRSCAQVAKNPSGFALVALVPSF